MFVEPRLLSLAPVLLFAGQRGDVALDLKQSATHVLLVLFGLFTLGRLFTHDDKGRLKSLNVGNARAKRHLGFLQISLQMRLTLLCRAHEIE